MMGENDLTLCAAEMRRVVRRGLASSFGAANTEPMFKDNKFTVDKVQQLRNGRFKITLVGEEAGRPAAVANASSTAAEVGGGKLEMKAETKAVKNA